jgi:hypothetical protein
MRFSAATSGPGKAINVVEQSIRPFDGFELHKSSVCFGRSARVKLQCLLLTQIQKSIAAGTSADAGRRKNFE